MKIKTSELKGAALNWAVAKCEGHDAHIYGGFVRTTMQSVFGPECHYPTDWAQGGPIIEREYIELTTTNRRSAEIWEAIFPGRGEDSVVQYGPTPLIAAMRCYAASKLGDEIEIPKELTS